MVRHTEADDGRTETDTITADVFHARFVDEDDDAFETTRDLRMGHEWAVEHDADPEDADVVEACYEQAGTVEVEVGPSDAPEAAAYSAWEDGEGHDVTSTRSMSVGDVIVVDRPGDDVAYFVDSIGFVEVDAIAFMRLRDDDETDEDDDSDDDFDDDRFASRDEVDQILEEARRVLGDDEVIDAIMRNDTKADTAADLAGDVVDAEDAGRDAYDMTPTDAEIAEAYGVDSVDEITDDMVDDTDVPTPPDRIDVSGYATAHGAAKAAYDALTEWAAYLFDAGDDVVLYDPDETRAKRDVADSVDAYTVAWEGGPHEWAVALTGGESLTAFEGPVSTGNSTPEVDGLLGGDGFDVECHYSFDLMFYNA